MTSTSDFYQSHLDRVSRSFAFCIAELEGNFKENVGLAYLLFRVLDCVEDYSWPSELAQDLAFEKFNAFVLKPATLADIKTWETAFPASIPDHERPLLSDTSLLLRDLHRLPDDKKEIFQRHLLNMSRGMQYYARLRQGGNALRVTKHAQLNGYCFFVAGLIGEFLSDIYTLCYLQTFSPEDFVNAVHFGLFLQKINILKDQRDDEAEGRFWIADREALVKELSYNAHRAFAYVKSISSHTNGYKIFCAWSLFLGLASYPYIEESFTKNNKLKISRIKAMALLSSIKRKILRGSDTGLDEVFAELVKNLSENQEPQFREPSKNFYELYSGRLEPAQLQTLNIELC